MTAVRLGVLTPSSNIVLEPITMAMLAGVSGVTAHFSLALSPACRAPGSTGLDRNMEVVAAMPNVSCRRHGRPAKHQLNTIEAAVGWTIRA